MMITQTAAVRGGDSESLLEEVVEYVATGWVEHGRAVLNQLRSMLQRLGISLAALLQATARRFSQDLGSASGAAIPISNSQAALLNMIDFVVSFPSYREKLKSDVEALSVLEEEWIPLLLEATPEELFRPMVRYPVYACVLGSSLWCHCFSQVARWEQFLSFQFRVRHQRLTPALDPPLVEFRINCGEEVR